MFDFLKKPKVEFIARSEGVDISAPIVPAKNLQPEWWKKLHINQNVKFAENSPISSGTVKRCMGIREFLENGWIMPMWCDLHLTITEDKISWTPSDDSFSFSVHSHEQMLEHVPQNAQNKYYFILKCISPWFLKTSKGYNTMLTNPFYHFNEYFDVATGISRSDYHISTNTFLMIKKKGDFLIKKGTPIALFFSYKREKFDAKIIPYGEKSLRLMNVFSRILLSKFSRVNSYTSMVKGGCPYDSMGKTKNL